MTTITEAKTRAPAKGVPGIPFAAMLSGNKEWEGATQQMFQSWKEQFDTGLKLIDTVVQGALQMRASQLAAAKDTHTRDLDAEKLVAGAKSLSDLLAIQLEWVTGNLERSMAYWNQMFQAATDANAKLAECLGEHEQARSGE